MKLFLILAFCLLPINLSLAAVAVDTADTVFIAGFDTATLTYTVTGSNTLALCGVSNVGGPAGADPATVTFNAVSMELISTQNPYENIYFSFWKLAGVSGTAISVVADFDGNGSYAGLGCVTFTGVDPTTPVGTVQIATSPASITVTVPANGLAADFGGNKPDECSSFTPTSGQTSLYGVCVNMDNNISLYASYRSTSGSFTWNPNEYPWPYWIQFGVPINPAAATTARRRGIVIQ